MNSFLGKDKFIRPVLLRVLSILIGCSINVFDNIATLLSIERCTIVETTVTQFLPLDELWDQMSMKQKYKTIL